MSDLHARAAAAGLQCDWEDANSRPQRVADDVLAAILDRLDMSAATEPFLTAEAGAAIAAPDGVTGDVELAMQDGPSSRLTIKGGALPAIDTVGYHRLISGKRNFTLAVAPRRCRVPEGRGWGAAVQIPALRDDRPGAYGDFGTLARSAAAFGRAGAAALAISPTHALFPADPTRFSPYSPSTRLFHNVALADPAMIGAPFGEEAAPALIDWPQCVAARLRHLRAVFDTAADGVQGAVSAFRAERGEALEAHARFDAMHAHLGGGGWRDWPTAYRDPAGEAVQRFAADHAQDVSFYAFLQWLAERGLAEAQRAAREHMRIGLVADLAVGMDSGGSHGWSRRGDLLTGLTVGAPPDPLGPDGQSWGITALDPFALARTGFAAFIETIRAALAHAGGIRIDHALGLDRLWVIPEGASAAEGAYLTMPGETLKRIIAIEAHRADDGLGAVVIAEDLGTVPPGFRDDLAARGMLGMRVLPFERDKAGTFVPPAKWDRQAVAMTGTHDTPTLAGWWRGRDIDWACRLGRGDASTCEADRRDERKGERASMWRAVGGTGEPPETPPIDTILTAVAAAPAPLAIVPLEDLAALEEQPNLPGTIDEHPNWRRRMPDATDAMLASPDVARRTALLTNERPG
ncbi:4-alpha-glucanotransferase [Sphingomonas gellani]|uniref:4-alpha-glucanotransferase n=1 Tax=Sphingomonas gellani TaxID=1166340 RepID=A0A1H8C6K7_9SPHN|nr:4-alpha-glucanotransferase [Sphingomonas gellani]SEM90074.1 4-alpha-glucanotransferase [Sphingomonas gellani]